MAHDDTLHDDTADPCENEVAGKRFPSIIADDTAPSTVRGFLSVDTESDAGSARRRIPQ